NFASNDLAIFSASGRSTEVYQTTLPSFFAASISCGVIALAAGAADMTVVENVAPTASAPEPTSTSRREIREPFIGLSSMTCSCFFAPRYCYPLSARQRSVGGCRQTVLTYVM